MKKNSSKKQSVKPSLKAVTTSKAKKPKVKKAAEIVLSEKDSAALQKLDKEAEILAARLTIRRTIMEQTAQDFEALQAVAKQKIAEIEAITGPGLTYSIREDGIVVIPC